MYWRGMVKLLKAQPGCASWLCVDSVPAFPFGGSFKAVLGQELWQDSSTDIWWIYSLHHAIYLIPGEMALKWERAGGGPTGGP